MAGNGKPPVLVVVQLSGGNDFMNTLIPYNSPIYWDCRPVVNVPQDTIIPLNDELGFHPKTAPLKEMFDEGNVALIQGIGYPNSNRSHFRAMDIWHTCEPDTVSTTGWLGQAIQDLDPDGENVLTGVNLGRGLPRAMTAPGVPVALIVAKVMSFDPIVTPFITTAWPVPETSIVLLLVPVVTLIVPPLVALKPMPVATSMSRPPSVKSICPLGFVSRWPPLFAPVVVIILVPPLKVTVADVELLISDT